MNKIVVFIYIYILYTIYNSILAKSYKRKLIISNSIYLRLVRASESIFSCLNQTIHSMKLTSIGM